MTSHTGNLRFNSLSSSQPFITGDPVWWIKEMGVLQRHTTRVVVYVTRVFLNGAIKILIDNFEENKAFIILLRALDSRPSPSFSSTSLA